MESARTETHVSRCGDLVKLDRAFLDLGIDLGIELGRYTLPIARRDNFVKIRDSSRLPPFVRPLKGEMCRTEYNLATDNGGNASSSIVAISNK